MKKNMEIGFIFSFDDNEDLLHSVEDFNEQTTEFYEKTRNYLTNLFTNDHIVSEWRETKQGKNVTEFINTALNDTVFYQVVKRVTPTLPYPDSLH